MFNFYMKNTSSNEGYVKKGKNASCPIYAISILVEPELYARNIH